MKEVSQMVENKQENKLFEIEPHMRDIDIWNEAATILDIPLERVEDMRKKLVIFLRTLKRRRK